MVKTEEKEVSDEKKESNGKALLKASKERNKKTAQLLDSIREQSKKIDKSNKDKLDKNQSLKLSRDEWKPEFLDSDKLKSISVNLEKNTLSLNMNNGFILAVMSRVYEVDFNSIKNQLQNTSEMIVFNSIISKEIKNKPAPFLKGICA